MENAKIYGWNLILSDFPASLTILGLDLFRRPLLGPMISVWFGFINSEVEQSYTPVESHGRSILC